MRVLIFGTYDLAAHPRVGIIAEGLRAHGFEVGECDAPLGFDTAERVRMLAQPWRVPLLGVRLASRWLELARRVRGMAEPDVVVVGYLGHFDVHLARLLFRGRRGLRGRPGRGRVPIVLDHLIGAADTARDRRVSGGLRQRLLRGVDAAALRAASLVVVDTEEHREALPPRHRERAVVVPVGASGAWFETGPRPDGSELSVVFYGLFTPLQGTATIGEALSLLRGVPFRATMIGHGQDLAEARARAGDAPGVRWLDWAAADELPALVAAHDVCLGIFGTGPKALRVVPNKVYQGAAAGCAVITSDTPPQRRAFGDAAVFVPPGDARALAAAIRRLAEHPDELAALRDRARAAARERFVPARVVDPLVERLASGG